jgi:hypothetical protein
LRRFRDVVIPIPNKFNCSEIWTFGVSLVMILPIECIQDSVLFSVDFIALLTGCAWRMVSELDRSNSVISESGVWGWTQWPSLPAGSIRGERWCPMAAVILLATVYPPDQLHLAKPTCIADFCGKITTWVHRNKCLQT